MNRPLLWCTALVVTAVTWTVTVYAQTTSPSRPPAVTKVKPGPQRIFATPEQAAAGLADAIRSQDLKQIHSVLGPGSGKVIHSGDPVQDAAGRKRFIEAYETNLKIERLGDAKVTLLIGSEEFPFPFPLVKTATGWRFDAKAGAEEVLNRRIGQNERAAIQVCLAYVDAQREYATKDRDKDGLLEYAHKFISTPGEHDGLYWETQEGEAASPLGPLSARAQEQGYNIGTEPYHGYYYKILTAQGADNPGGAYSYIVRGKMIGGFALVAYPARWGASGVMSFICNHQGVVYEKNLGKDTVAVAERMTRYNPDTSWKKIEE
ncbi:MAG TPA: DUF2950 domain-containing protein [Casimicrobiaceae bacterium]|nr:DUF2950 domain-containing protein [Casimicrobiaceae bacterium]